jgi:membrane associated rhomboid family serine protease
MIKSYNYLNLSIWLVLIICPFLLQEVGVIVTSVWSTSPSNGLISILTGTFLHGSYSHMVGNLTGIIISSTIIYNFYHKDYFSIVVLGIFLPSAFAYFFTPHYTIGISGLVYTLIWFTIIRGLISKDRTRLFLGIGMAMFYGTSIKGAIPQGFGSQIAWYCHLMGILTALIYAVYSRLIRIS